MTENSPANPDESIDENAAAAEFQAQKQAVGKLYRLREVLAGLIALAEDGSISSHQVKAGLRKAFQKAFP
jgi:hypothetical protein